MRAWVGVWWGTKSTDAVLSIYDDGTEGSAIPRIQNDIMFFLDREGYIDANSNLHLTGCRLPTWNEPPLEPAYRPVVDALVPFQSANITIRFNAVNNTSTTSRQHTLLSIILRGPRIELLKAFVRHCRNYARDHTVEPSGGIWQYGFTSTSRGVICAWSYSPLHLTKSLDNVFIASKARLRADLDAFIDRDTEARYRRWGVPYKRSYLFCGPPGTGKSSLVFAIASHTKRPIYWLPKASEIKDAHGATIGAIFGAIKPYSVVVIDDIDVRMETKRSGSEPGGRSMTSDDFFLSMLEVLDGYRHLHGCIVIATTNHPEKLDPALRRAGRFDLELEIGLLTDGTLDEMLAFYFGADLDAAEMREARALCVGKMSSATLINTYSVPAINAHPLNVRRYCYLYVYIASHLHTRSKPRRSPIASHTSAPMP
jgi:chaperone BCS1